MEASEHPVSLMHNSGLEMEDVCVLQQSISQVVWHRCGVICHMSIFCNECSATTLFEDSISNIHTSNSVTHAGWPARLILLQTNKKKLQSYPTHVIYYVSHQPPFILEGKWVLHSTVSSSSTKPCAYRRHDPDFTASSLIPATLRNSYRPL